MEVRGEGGCVRRMSKPGLVLAAKRRFHHRIRDIVLFFRLIFIVGFFLKDIFEWVFFFYQKLLVVLLGMQVQVKRKE